MITVHYSTDGNVHELSVEGHAEYAEHGKDIVCAGVSALTQALLGWIDDHSGCVTDLEGPAVQRGHFWMRCKGNKTVTIAFQVAVTGFKQIANAYPGHVEFQYSGPDR